VQYLYLQQVYLTQAAQYFDLYFESTFTFVRDIIDIAI